MDVPIHRGPSLNRCDISRRTGVGLVNSDLVVTFRVERLPFPHSSFSVFAYLRAAHMGLACQTITCEVIAGPHDPSDIRVYAQDCLPRCRSQKENHMLNYPTHTIASAPESSKPAATDRVDQGGSVTFRTFLSDSKFFFTLYHAGKVNIILHLVSFSFLFYGLAVKSVPLVLIWLFIFDEMGHAYNYFFMHNRDPRFGLRMISY